MRKRITLAVVGLLAVTLLACSNTPKPKPLPPGAANQTDANFYDALVTARGAIDGACQAGTSVTTGNCTIKPELAAYKPQLNQAIHSWNIAAAAQTTYRNALKSGGNPDSAVVASAVTQATADAAALITSMLGGK